MGESTPEPLAPRRVHPSCHHDNRLLCPGDIRKGRIQRAKTKCIGEFWRYRLGRSWQFARWYVCFGLRLASRKNLTTALSLHAVKYFSPTIHLCIIRIARGNAARTTWAALVLLDRIGNNEGGSKVVPHVIHVSGALPITMIK